MDKLLIPIILIILFFGVSFVVTKNAVLTALEEFHDKHK